MGIKKTWLCTQPIAHRGLHNSEFPENSLAAFNNAIENNFAIELDVQLIDDGTVIVYHDSDLKRMTLHDGYVSNLTADRLGELRLLGTDEKIPTFEQTLEAINGKAPLLIEIKNVGKIGELEKKVAEILASYKGDFAVQSFNPYSMEYYKNNATGFIRGQLSSVFTKPEMSSWIRRFAFNTLKVNKFSEPDFLAFNAEHLPNKRVSKTKLPVLAWTVRSNTEMERVAPYCDNIIFENFIPVRNKNND